MAWEMHLQNLFLEVVNLSITASWVIAAVLLLRLILKPVPKKYVCLLWLVVLFRLLCPVTVESSFGLVPQHEPVKYEIVYTTPQITTPSEPVNTVIDQTVNPVLEANSAPNPMASANPLQIYIFFAACIWVIGMLGLCGYTLFSWLRLRRQVEEAEPKEKGVYLCGTITSPFVFGVIRPKIYVPYGMSEEQERYALLHERSHIARKDFIVKPLFWLAVIIHWMNPLVWIAWYYFGRDIELACDERAIDQLNDMQKCDYSTTLVQLATQPKCLHCPMAFGNNSVKQRIKRVLEYKKLPVIARDWILIIMIVLSVGLVANQKYYLLEECEMNLVEKGEIPKEYSISKVWFRWGSVTDIITDQDEITRLKERIDDLQVKPIRNRNLDPDISYYEQIGGALSFYDENGESLSLLNIGISPDFSQIYGYGIGAEWDVKSTAELKSLVQPLYKAALQNHTDTTFHADLNHDGSDELIIVNVTEWSESNPARLAIYSEEGNGLFYDDVYSSHSGWGNYFLLERDGKDYLVEFMPSMYQGYATYSWQLLDFDKNNKLRVVEEDAVDFTVNPQQFEFDIDEIENFMEGAERVIRPAMLLVSTNDGELRYSTTEQYQTLTTESFITTWLHDSEGYRALTPEEQAKLSLKEKLQLKQDEIYYSKLGYELHNWMWEKQHVSTAEKYFTNPQIIEIDGTRCVSFEWRWYPDSLNAGALIDTYAITAIDTDDFMQMNAGYNYYRYDDNTDEWILLDNSNDDAGYTE